MYVYIYIYIYLCTYHCYYYYHVYDHYLFILWPFGAQAAHQGLGEPASMAPRRSLLEAAFDGESASKRPHRGQPLTVAQQVTKALQDNFKNFSEQEIDGTIVNGSSLRARLTKDKAKNVASPGSVTMGRLYAQSAY